MILFLTGATSSLRKSDVAPQADPNKSLGGWVSSSPVPNAALNELFDLVSTGMLSDRPKETLALGLINQLAVPVTNVRLSIVVNQHPVCEWRVAATALSSDLRMESIPNRYSEPMSAIFYDATFQRASVEFDLKGDPAAEDQFLILPLGVVINVTAEGGVKGFWNGLKNACREMPNYGAERVADRRFRICATDEAVAPTAGLECHCVKDSAAEIEFLGKYINGATGSVLLVDASSTPQQRIAPGDGIGLWLQREVSADWERPTDQELIEMKKRGEILPTVEQAEVVITYDEVIEETTEEQGE